MGHLYTVIADRAMVGLPTLDTYELTIYEVPIRFAAFVILCNWIHMKHDFTIEIWIVLLLLHL